MAQFVTDDDDCEVDNNNKDNDNDGRGDCHDICMEEILTKYT